MIMKKCVTYLWRLSWCNRLIISDKNRDKQICMFGSMNAGIQNRNGTNDVYSESKRPGQCSVLVGRFEYSVIITVGFSSYNHREQLTTVLRRDCLVGCPRSHGLIHAPEYMENECIHFPYTIYICKYKCLHVQTNTRVDENRCIQNSSFRAGKVLPYTSGSKADNIYRT